MLKDPEIAKKLEQQLSNGENSKPQSQSAPEPPKVSVPTPSRQTPILQSKYFFHELIIFYLILVDFTFS